MEQQETTVAPHIKNKHTDDLIDHYWGSINYVSALIKASELKAGLILSFYGILLNFIYQNLDVVIADISGEVVLYVFLVLWFCSTVTSIYFSIRCFMPRIEDKYDKNVFFFGDVISKFGNIKEFSRTFYEISLDEDQVFDQLGQQIFINSKIAARKFRDVNRALKFLALGLFLLLLTVVYYVLASI